ncbi:MAG: hypothetical protein CMO01_13595 [Thalassobius sp.]|nr:hypothetical protein [Thalassovita sp.]
MNYLKLSLKIGLLLFSFNAFSQNVTGPKMKNSKPWERQSAVLVTRQNVENPTGPQAKNAKIWEQNEGITTQVQSGQLQDVSGPEMKNIALYKKRHKEEETEHLYIDSE